MSRIGKQPIEIPGQVLIFTYEPSGKGTIDYLQTFQMMNNSVELLPPAL